MDQRHRILPILFLYGVFCLDTIASANTITLDFNDNTGDALHKAIIDIQTGDTIILPKGIIQLKKVLSIFNNNITIQGQGQDQTVLDFKGVKEGAQAILIRSHHVQLSDFTIKNSPGDGVVARAVRHVTLKNLQVFWEEDQETGGYGLYPVQCKEVVVEGNTVSGANEAGIYVGQTINARIANNIATKNVVGIDVENSSYVKITDNIAERNSIGIAVTNRPYLVVINPHHILIENNTITDNNLKNFASQNSFASALGEGHGIEIISTDMVHIADNRFAKQSKADIYVDNFPILNRVYNGDAKFDIDTDGISVDAKQFSGQPVTIHHPVSKEPSRQTEASHNILLGDIFNGPKGEKNQVVCLEGLTTMNADKFTTPDKDGQLTLSDIICAKQSSSISK